METYFARTPNATPRQRPVVHAGVLPGLSVVENFLTLEEEQKLVAAVERGAWEGPLKRLVQQYGYAYSYTARTVDREKDSLGPLPKWVEETIDMVQSKAESRAAGVTARPEQCIVNRYLKGEGIAPHTDAAVFGDCIWSLSLLSDTDFVFARPGHESLTWRLKRGSLLVMTGDARWRYTHTIPCRLADSVNGAAVERKTRYSITFRTLRALA